MQDADGKFTLKQIWLFSIRRVDGYITGFTSAYDKFKMCIKFILFASNKFKTSYIIFEKSQEERKIKIRCSCIEVKCFVFVTVSWKYNLYLILDERFEFCWTWLIAIVVVFILSTWCRLLRMSSPNLQDVIISLTSSCIQWINELGSQGGARITFRRLRSWKRF